MHDRIKQLRKNLKLSQKEFAEKLKLQQNTICMFETGRRNPSERTIDDMCSVFHVSREWLLNGTGEIFIKTTPAIMEQLRKEYHLNDFDFNLVYEYLKLDKHDRAILRNFIRNIAKYSDTAEENSEKQ